MSEITLLISNEWAIGWPFVVSALIGIALADYEILKVGFDSPRGWHEPIHSNFYFNRSEN